MGSHVPHGVYTVSGERILSIVCGGTQRSGARPQRTAHSSALATTHGLRESEALQLLAWQDDRAPRQSEAPAGLWADATAGSSEARDRLFAHYAYLVREVHGRLTYFLPHGKRHERYLAAGRRALAEAIGTYRTGGRESFEIHATAAIGASLLECAGLCTKASAMDCWWTERLLGTMAALSDKLGRASSDDEVAAVLGVDLGALHGLYERHVSAMVAMDLVPSARGGDGLISMATAAYFAQAMSADEQRLLSLYYSDGLPLDEIAEILGLPEGQVRERHGRVTAYLCSRLLYAGTATGQEARGH